MWDNTLPNWNYIFLQKQEFLKWIFLESISAKKPLSKQIENAYRMTTLLNQNDHYIFLEWS